MCETDSGSSYDGLEMTSSRLERRARRKQIYEMRVRDPINSSIGQLGRWQYQLVFLLILTRIPSTLFQIMKGCANIYIIPCQTFNETESFDKKENSSTTFDQTLPVIAFCLGNFIFGHLGDSHGRKPSLTIAIFIQTVCSILSGFIPWYWTICVLRFLIHFASGGILILSFILVIEFCGLQSMPLASTLSILPSGLVFFMPDILRKWFHTWQDSTTYLISGYLVLILIIACLIPESPQWFFMTGSINRTTKILTNAARINGISYKHISNVIAEAQKRKTNEQLPLKGLRNFIKLFSSSSRTSLNMICMSMNWILLHNWMNGEMLSHLLISVHDGILIKMMIIHGSSIIIGIILSYPLMKYLGPKVTLISIHLLIGFSILLTIIVPKKLKWIRVILFLITMTGSGFLNSIVHVYVIELFPIHIRTTGMGCSSSIGRIGLFLIHIAIQNHQSVFWLASAIYGCTHILIGALVVYCLPEIKNKNTHKDGGLNET